MQHPIGLTAQLQDTWWAWVWGLVFASGGDMFDEAGNPVMDDGHRPHGTSSPGCSGRPPSAR